ncbi:hypothetical protein C8J56DRAFT_792749 [Mycena floridula]|nr:hypothetical protein C8J56DRAFT_792749 [Mycena floridula]
MAHGYNVRFGEVSAAEAARGYNNKPKGRPENLNARSLGTDINWNALKLTENQRKDIHTIYQNGRNVDHKFYAYGDLAAESQREAAALLASYGLDLDSRDEPANRWSVKWSMKSPGQNTVPTRRVLSHDCGYDHTVHGSVKRNTPAPFVGCLAHVEVTYVEAAGAQQILRIRGFLEHNEACKDALLTRVPRQSLHPAVFQTALAQLSASVSLSEVQKQNRALVKTNGYPDMSPDPRHWKYRYLLRRGDMRSLYRQYSRMKGINTAKKPQINVDQWLDPNSPNYNKTFADAVFHYSARTSQNERFEACVATDEMKEMASSGKSQIPNSPCLLYMSRHSPCRKPLILYRLV